MAARWREMAGILWSFCLYTHWPGGRILHVFWPLNLPIFSNYPPLHLFVPHDTKATMLIQSYLTDIYCPQARLIGNLLRRALRFGVVHVRGTPASGRTSTIAPLHQNILAEQPKFQVYTLTGWRKQDVTENGCWENHLVWETGRRGWGSFGRSNVVVLIDEAQETF